MTNENIFLTEPIEGKTYFQDGWMYRDIPWTTSSLWDMLLKNIGNENIVILTKNCMNDYVRGQVLISPSGIENLKALT